MLYIDGILDDLQNRRCTIICSDRLISPSDFYENEKEFFDFLEENMTKLDEVHITGESIQSIEGLKVLCMFISLFSIKVHLYLTDTENIEIIDSIISNQYAQSYTIIGK